MCYNRPMNIKQFSTILLDADKPTVGFFGLGDDRLVYRYNPVSKAWVVFDAETNFVEFSGLEEPKPIKPPAEDPV